MSEILYKPIEYVNLKCDGIKISPSGLATFRRDPEEWLANIEGRGSFKGNRATIYGTGIHYLFEQYTLAKMHDIAIEDISDDIIFNIIRHYVIDQHNMDVITGEEVDWILDNIQKYQLQVKDFVEEDSKQFEYIEIETSKLRPVGLKDKKTLNRYYIGGSLDALVKDKSTGLVFIRDYKTSASAKKSLDSYLPQLNAYRFIWHKEEIFGYQVINIVTLKSKMTIKYIQNVVTANNYNGFKALLREVIETHDIGEKNPELKPYLFRKGVNFQGGFDL